MNEKEKAAEMSSVGAEDRQSFDKSEYSIANPVQESKNQGKKIYNDELAKIYRQAETMLRTPSNPPTLQTVTSNKLFETVYDKKPPLIEGLLYPGTYIFAGAPKVGKSFMMAQLAYHVSSGAKLWDFPVNPGTVLYLALEDDYQRIQDRMFRMYGVEGNENLHFAVDAVSLSNGLDGQLEAFIRKHPDTKLVIIDTLQKIRETASDSYSYSEDYKVVGKIKQIADENGVCLLIVHHTRKTKAGDAFEMISGTTGLLGCADGAFVLRKQNRTDRSAVLEIVGRDQPDQKIYLTRDEERLIWNLDHVDQQIWKDPPDPVVDKVVGLISGDRTAWVGSATDLLNELEITKTANALTRHLNVKAGKLLSEFGIKYENSHGREGSVIRLERVS
jgi:hypothetical protein